MTFPVFLRIGPLVLHPHWVFETLAYSVGFLAYRRLRVRTGDVVDAGTRWWIIGAAAVGGLAGSRLLALFEDPARIGELSSDPIALLSGKTIVGGLIGGLAAVEWIKRRLHVTVATGDLLAMPLALGIAVGRIGCFLSGLADGSHGVATSAPWGVDFGDGVSRHPTQLYEVLFLIILAVVLASSARRLTVVGDRFKLFMIGYMAFRLLADFLKPAPRVAGLSIIQWACLATIAYYAPHVPRLVTGTARG
jgi:prolipoprotein diacylglyceryltransferase